MSTDLDTLLRLVDHAVQLRITRNRLETELRIVNGDLNTVLAKIENQRAKMFLPPKPRAVTIDPSRDAVGSPPNGQDTPTTEL